MAGGQGRLSSMAVPAPRGAALTQLALAPAVEAATRGDLGSYRAGFGSRSMYEIPSIWMGWSARRAWVAAVAGGTFAAEYLRWPSAGILGHVTVAASATAAGALGVWGVHGGISRWGAGRVLGHAQRAGAWQFSRTPGP